MKEEIYTPGHGAAAIQFMSRRSLGSHGKFAAPLFQEGMRILDLGCGPGTITLDIARAAGPVGKVVGVDREGAQFPTVDDALPVQFETMDAYNLSLEDDSFDGVFSHALFEHLTTPQRALAEAWRVIKPGGFAALRSPDWGGFVLEPWSTELQAALTAREKLQTRNGGDPFAGRKLGTWLGAAGFVDVRVTASYEIYPDNDPIVDHIVTQLEADGQSGHAACFRKWGSLPHAMFAQAWFEAIGRKPFQAT